MQEFPPVVYLYIGGSLAVAALALLALVLIVSKMLKANSELVEITMADQVAKRDTTRAVQQKRMQKTVDRYNPANPEAADEDAFVVSH